MKFFLMLLMVGLWGYSHGQVLNLQTDCGRGTASLNRIMGGTVAEKGDWGWQVALKRGGKFGCGGALINANYVITAAHCLDEIGSINPSSYTVDIGFHNRAVPDEWSITKKVVKIIMHPKYDRITDRDDIALLKLDSPVKFDEENYKITPACVSDGSENYVDRIAWATGYGTLFQGGSSSNELRQVSMPILTDAACSAKFWNRVDAKTQVCAGIRNGKDTCQGDSGGPLVVKSNVDGRWHLVGLTSFGGVCGTGGVYSRVSGYNNWILSNIQN